MPTEDAARRYRRVKTLLAAALERPVAEREAFVRQEAGTDAALAEEVLRLLLQEAPTGFLDPGALQLPEAETSPDGAQLRPGDRVDRYALLEQIGEGGFGRVWLAEQREPVRRRVALKIIKRGMDTRQVIARFEAERQVLAMLDHPSIAKVLDAGATESGRPYFLMEYIDGQPITSWCDEARLPTDARLELFLEVCLAIQHAHQKGVIHRDIKPSNVLVTRRDGVPVPKVIDFGIAKATGPELAAESLMTGDQQVLGTPIYMSPEQAEAAPDVDTRADIYSLGVLLYELLTGTTPFKASGAGLGGLGALVRAIREEPPSRPSARVSDLGGNASEAAERRRTDRKKLYSTLRGELDWIVLRCLEKDRARRYDAAGDLAEDVRRYLNDEPVLARPPKRGYRLRKFVHRHRLESGAAAVLLLGLVGAVVISTRALFEAETARAELAREFERANAATARAEAVNAFLEDMLAAADTRERGRDVRMVDVLESAVAKARTLGSEPLVRASVLETIGNTYRGLGDYQRADGLLGEALALRTAAQGPLHPDTLTVRNDRLENLGISRGAESAREAFEALHADASRVLEDTHPLMMSIDNNLGTLWLLIGVTASDEAALERGLAYSKRSLELRARVLGPRAADTSHARNSVASAYQRLGQEARAEALYRENLAIQQELFGPTNRYTLGTLVNLGNLLADRGAFDEAEALLREAVTRMEAALGRSHMNTLLAMADLAYILFDRGDAEAGHRVLEEGLRRARAAGAPPRALRRLEGVAARFPEPSGD